MSDPERRARVRSTLRLAAAYVAEKDRGRPVQWIPEGRMTRLDGEGKPTGPAIAFGPAYIHLYPTEGEEA